MQECTTCRYTNHAGALICGNCGAPMHPGFKAVETDSAPKRKMVKKLLSFLSRVETRHLNEETQTQKLDLAEFVDEPAQPQELQDVSYFGPRTSITLRIDQFELFIERPTTEVVLGRFGDMVTVPREVHPVNLSEYAGYAMGVSRIHCSLRPNDQNQLEVMDLASSNGTFLNGYPLNAYEVYHVYHGDEVRLGHMRMTILFTE